MRVEQVTTPDAVAELVAGLQDPARSQPWCVVSTPFDPAGFRLDLEEIDRQVGDLCRIFTLETGDLSRHLAREMPDRTEVYGGAARSFPPGVDWMFEPRLTKFRLIHLPSQAGPMTDQVIGDLFTMAYQSGITRAPEPSSREASGTVKGIIAGTRAIVTLDSGEPATIVHELTYPDAPLEWVIEPGQRISGSFDPTTKRLTPASVAATEANLLQWYPDRRVTLALVVSTERQRAMLAVHPAVPIVMERRDISSNPRDRVDLLLTPGDVIPVRVIRDEQGRTRLRSNDIDDDETVHDAPAVFVDGAPWLRPDRVLSTTDENLTVVSLEEFLASSTIFSETFEPAALDAHPPAPETDTVRVIVAPRPGPGLAAATAATAPASAAPAATAPATPAAPAAATAATASLSSGLASKLGLSAGADRRAALNSALLKIDVLSSDIIRLQSENQFLKNRERKITGEQAIHEISRLNLLVADALRDRDAAKARAIGAERELREVKALMRRARSETNSTDDPLRRRDRFANTTGDAEAWVRHEILRAWIERLDPHDRVRYPISSSYLVGERFAESLEALESGQLTKAFKAVVDVLSGYVSEIASRNVHPLRTGAGGDDAALIRADGARCYRAYIEQNTPSARRLHYWKHPNGQLELSRIVTHDDLQP